MAVSIQLKNFDVKASPVPADLVYLANSADSFNEVQSTIAQVIAAYPALSSIAELTTTADELIYTTAPDTYAVAPLTVFGRSVLALSAATTAPTAGVLAGWDANKNLRANNFLPAFTTTATAAGTTTLTVASSEIQEFTGSTTQTVVLPVTSTLLAGQGFTIINNSSGALTVNSSGGNLVQTMGGGTSLYLICVLTSGTTAASWQSSYSIDVFPLSIINGGTGVTALPTLPTASAFSAWDVNSNFSAVNLLAGFATTVSAAGTTILTVASAYNREITGSTTQTIQLPVASTLSAGHPFKIINNSSGNVTINSSGGNAILVLAANTIAFLTCVLNSGTTAASWNASYIFDNGAGVLSLTGTANQIIFSASTGAITASLPQDIAPASTPKFVNSIPGFTTTATAAGTTTLTTTSNYVQVFTGITTQIVQMPVTSTLQQGQSWEIVNNSTDIVTVNSSGSNAIVSLPANSAAIVTCVLTSGTTAASWTTMVGTTGAAAIIDSFVTYTPTFTGFGTPSNVSIWSRRVGDCLEIRGKFTSGTPTAVEARISLGYNGTNANVTSSATKVTTIQAAGDAVVSVAQAAALYTLIESNVGYITLGNQSASTSGLTKQNANILAVLGTSMSIYALIPITGW